MECKIVEDNSSLIIGLSVGGGSVVLIIIFVAIFIICLMMILQKKNDENKMKDICVFKMKRSNIDFNELKDNIMTNKIVLSFDLDMEEIPVNEETKDLICIGNKCQNKIKIQFTVREGCEKYQIRTNPKLINLKKGEACEFEVFIIPLCSCQIEDQLIIIALDIKEGKEIQIPIPINFKTQASTHLDYDELIQEKKLGEGSFGIVYLGTFRGNKVAIKRMKQVNCSENGIIPTKKDDYIKAIDEFEKEVSMLDKFRCDYIIHFYGAVFIETKICMVTEFAQHGSIQDLMNKLSGSNGINNKMRVKLMADAAKGIKYLHENGILHRDIKPDNFLVITLEENVNVNAKLTDFGSSRNVNMMMTNMTFTKGVGTPKYMAPEVLRKSHYKMPADIFAFAVTMYEVFGWISAYPKSDFKFPWKIAEYITNGNRLPLDHLTPQLANIIESSWNQEPSERLTINEIVEHLNKQLFEM